MFSESARNILTADVFVVSGFEFVKDGHALLQEIRRRFELRMDQIRYRLSQSSIKCPMLDFGTCLE